jgi:hypothetical protein
MRIIKSINNLVMSGFLSAFLLGCGSEKVPDAAPAGVIRGNAVDALIIGGTVRAYNFKEGMKGEEISTAPVVTDENGFFSIDVKANHDQPIVLEVVGGRYIEEASGKTVSLNEKQFLRAVYNYKHGSDISMMVTTWTHLAAADASYKISQGIDATASINQANKDISDWLGVDIVTTYPINITDPNFTSEGFYDGIKYGLAGAALSQWTLDIADNAGLLAHDIFSSIAVNNIMYNDISSDGKLDGIVDGAHVVMGGIELTADVYRQSIAASALRVIQRDGINKVGISLVDSMPFVASLASTSIPLFSDDTPLAIDTTLPVIEISNTPLSTKETKINFVVTDFVGVEKVELYIDSVFVDEFVGEAGGISFDSRDYEDGDLQIEIQAVDVVGNVSSKFYTTRVANNDIAVTVSSGDVINYSDYTLMGEVVNAVNAYELTVDNGKTIIDGSTFSTILALSDGINDINGNVTDSLGRTSAFTKIIYVDKTAPKVKVVSGDNVGLWLNGVISKGGFPVNNSKALYLSYSNLYLGLIDNKKADLTRNNITFLDINPQDLGEVATSAEDLKVSYSVSNNNEMVTQERTIVRNSSDEWLLPITADFIDNLLAYSVDDEIKIVINVVDSVGNITSKEFNFRVFIDLPFLSQKTMFKSSDILLSHYHSPGKGAEIIGCKTGSLLYCKSRLNHSTDAMNVSLSNGFYVDTLKKEWEVTEEFQTLVDFYEAYKEIHLTPLSAGYKGFFDFGFAQHTDTERAMAYARTSMINYYSFDPLTTAVSELCEGCELTPGRQHALYLGGMSVLAEKLDTSPLNLMKVFSDDVSADGYLNGKGSNGLALTIKGYEVTSATFRRDLAIAINEHHALLGKPLGNTEIGIWAQEISLKTSTIFDPADIPELMDNNIPTISSIDKVGEWVSGLVDFNIETSDDIGISKVSLWFSTDFISEKFNSFLASFVVDTTTYADGEHEVKVDFVDDINNQETSLYKVSVDNTAPILTAPNLQDKWIKDTVDFTVSIDEASPFKHVLKVGDIKVGESDNNTIAFDTTGYSDGALVVSSSVTDSVKKETVLNVTTLIDNNNPVITGSGQHNSWKRGKFDYQLTVADASPTIASITEAGIVIGTINNGEKLNINTKDFTDGLKILTTEAVDSVGKTASKVERIGFDNTKPVVYESPLSGRWHRGSVTFTAQIDELSPYVNTVTVDNVKIGDLTTNIVTINTTAYADGEHDLGYSVVDSVGLQTNKVFDFKLDNTKPLIGNWSGANKWHGRSVNFSASIADTTPLTTSLRVAGKHYPGFNRSVTKALSLADGQHTATISTTDSAGNSASKAFAFSVDNTAPVITVAKPTYNVIDISSVVVSGAVSDGTSGVASVTINGSSASVSGASWSKTLTGLAEGLNRFNVVVHDNAGHTSSTAFDVYRTKIPANKMAATITCEGTSKSTNSGSSLSCNTSTLTASDTIDLSAAINVCAGSATCSVAWSGAGISVSGDNATITKSLSLGQTINGTALARFTDSINGQIINFNVHWSMTRNGECEVGDSRRKNYDSCPGGMRVCESGTQVKICRASNTWGPFEVTRRPICKPRNHQCP